MVIRQQNADGAFRTCISHGMIISLWACTGGRRSEINVDQAFSPSIIIELLVEIKYRCTSSIRGEVQGYEGQIARFEISKIAYRYKKSRRTSPQSPSQMKTLYLSTLPSWRGPLEPGPAGLDRCSANGGGNHAYRPSLRAS